MTAINATVIVGKAVLVAAFAAAPVLLSAVAHAEPDPAVPAPDPRAHCESPEFGGVFVVDPAAQDGVARGVCQYIVEGYFYYDNYENGIYTGTLVYRDGGRVPTERPPLPETLPGAIPAPLLPF